MALPLLITTLLPGNFFCMRPERDAADGPSRLTGRGWFLPFPARPVRFSTLQPIKIASRSRTSSISLLPGKIPLKTDLPLCARCIATLATWVVWREYEPDEEYVGLWSVFIFST